MPPTTRSRANKKVTNEPTQPTLKKNPTPRRVRSTVRTPAITEEERAAIGKVAALEAQLRGRREAELQEALTLPTPSRQAATEHPIPRPATRTTKNQSSHHDDAEQEEGGVLIKESPLFISDTTDDQFSLATGEQDHWESELEWTGFDNDESASGSEGNVDVADEPPPATMQPATQRKPKAGLKKPFVMRDLVKAQIRVDDQSKARSTKKRKLTNDGDRPAIKRIASKSGIENTENGLTIRPGFLEDDDMKTIKHERKGIKGEKGRSSKSVVRVTHENAPPPKAEEKRKKSSIPNHYLKDFDKKFMPELIKRVSDDLNPWQPTFDADSAIEEIRQQVYPNVIEVFENKDPLFAPAFNKVTNWRAAIGRRAMGIVNTYFGDKSVFSEAEEIEEHVQWLLPNKDEEADEGADEDGEDDEDDEDDDIDIEEIVRRRKRKFVGAPFLYENGLIGPAKEPPSGYLLSPLVLKTFAIHFDTTGINANPTVCKSQVGALALTLTAVERAISCWETGKEKKPSKAFSQVEYGATTQEYVEALRQVPTGHWELVLASTRQYTPWKQDAVELKEKKPGARARVPAGL